MKITQATVGPSRHYEHCCDCGSMQTKFDPIQHEQHCAQIAKEQGWTECRVCKAETDNRDINISEVYKGLQATALEHNLYIVAEGRHFHFYTKPSSFSDPYVHRSIGFESADNFVLGWVFGRDFEKKMGLGENNAG